MEKTTNVIIAGTRTFNDYNLVCKVMNVIRSKYANINIVSNNEPGANKCGLLYALKNKIPYTIYEPDGRNCDRDAKSAMRERMTKASQVLVLFWDRESSESEDMLYLAVRYELTCYIMLYKTNEFYAGHNAIEKIYDTILPF